MFQKQYAPRWAMLGVIAALFIAVFSIPSARALASDFLGLFRVQKFAAISIDPAQLERLEDLDLEGLFPGELTMLAEPTEPTAVDTLEQAATNADYTPKTIPTLGNPDSIMVASGGAGKAADFAPAVQAGADAVLAASVFHYGQLTIGEVKQAMAEAGITVRLT